MAGTRFWGTVVAVKPRLVVAKFEGETTARCHGHLVILDGTAPEPGRFTIAFGPATQDKRALSPGDLLRGDAHPVPETVVDTPADLYRVGTLRVVARSGDPGTPPPRPLDPPRTDPPLTPEQAEAANRRALAAENLDPETGECLPCPYGAFVPVVRLSDPRDFRNGRWTVVPACLGPLDCPHFRPYAPPPQPD